MNRNDFHLEKLLDAYFEDRLDATQHGDLDELLKSSAAARKAFWDRAGMEGALETWAEKSRGASMVFPAAAQRPHSAWRRRLPLISGWAAAAVLTLAWILHSRPASTAGSPVAVSPPENSRTSTPPAEVQPSTPVAYLSRISGLKEDARLLQGQSLVAGHEIKIGEGILEVDFYSGARVSIQGPASFVPDSDMRLTVRDGTVQVDVPDSAKGFVLALPDCVVTDFGTSFGAEIRNAKTSRLQVNRGEIELAGTKAASVKRMFRGEAVSLEAGGVSKPIQYQPMAMKHMLDETTTRDNEARSARWEKVCTDLSTDLSMLVHFRFLPDEAGSREIINRAHGPNAPATGTVIAAEWARGRWPGKGALAFHSLSDRVRVDIPGEYPRVSYLAWVKVDGLPRRYNGLFLSESQIPGEAHWQFSELGGFMFGVRPRDSKFFGPFHRAFSQPVLTSADFGPWRMLATTYDSATREVLHFVDGEVVYRSRIEDSVPVRFGRSTLGNFFDPQPAEHAGVPGLGEDWSYRNWSGSIDEFMLFSRVLSPGEVTKLYEAGRPD